MRYKSLHSELKKLAKKDQDKNIYDPEAKRSPIDVGTPIYGGSASFNLKNQNST